MVMSGASSAKAGGGRIEVAVDVGGTFTDGVLLDTATDRIYVAKALTTALGT